MTTEKIYREQTIKKLDYLWLNQAWWALVLKIMLDEYYAETWDKVINQPLFSELKKWANYKLETAPYDEYE